MPSMHSSLTAWALGEAGLELLRQTAASTGHPSRTESSGKQQPAQQPRRVGESLDTWMRIWNVCPQWSVATGPKLFR